MSDNDEYLQAMDKSAQGICPECGKTYTEHVYPQITPCPKCGKTDTVVAWEAWGHPSGELYCQACTGFLSDDPSDEYWTFYRENGRTVIVPWHTVENES